MNRDLNAVRLVANVLNFKPDGDIRQRMVEDLDFLGISIDPQRNNVRSKVAELSPEGSPVKVWMIPTDEELVIARDTEALVEGRSI